MKKDVFFPLHDLIPLISWDYFFMVWGLSPRFAAVATVHDCPSCRAAWVGSLPEADREAAREAIRLYDEARQLLRHLDATHEARGRVVLIDAWSEGEDVCVATQPATRLPFLRQQRAAEGEPCLCLADFIRPRAQFLQGDAASQLGIFCTTVVPKGNAAATDGTTDEPTMLQQVLCDRLAEAAAERLHAMTDADLWSGLPAGNRSIRPAVGYPSLPDQSFIFLLDSLIGFSEVGITLTESGMMLPHASVCGLLLAHPAATYFPVGRIGEEQLQDYARRRGVPADSLRKYLRKNLE